MSIKIYSRFKCPITAGFTNIQPTMTQQHFKEDADINIIMKRYQQTGVLPQVNSSAFGFYDAGDSLTYQEALNFIIEADDNFMALPSVLRSMFDNDPSKFLSFVENADNYDECVRLGIFEPTNVVPVSPLDVTGTTDTKTQEISEISKKETE